MRPLLAPLLAAALLALAAASAQGNAAYDRVAEAYAQGGGQLDPCRFTQDQLEAGLAGIPKAIAQYVPDVRRAIRQGIAVHERGGCAGRDPDAPVSSDGAGAVPPVTTPPPAATAPTTTAPPATTAPPSSATATGAPQPEAATADGSGIDPLLLALGALGALLLLALALWAWGWTRGWDPGWTARTRHAWGEAGYRTAGTWSEFTDWLRLGR